MKKNRHGLLGDGFLTDNYFIFFSRTNAIRDLRWRMIHGGREGILFTPINNQFDKATGKQVYEGAHFIHTVFRLLDRIGESIGTEHSEFSDNIGKWESL